MVPLNEKAQPVLEGLGAKSLAPPPPSDGELSIWDSGSDDVREDVINAESCGLRVAAACTISGTKFEPVDWG